MSQTESDLGFASDEDVPISYMTRTRDWYLALGYGNPYRWAHYAEVPFAPLRKPLAQMTVALLTTHIMTSWPTIPGNQAMISVRAFTANG